MRVHFKEKVFGPSTPNRRNAVYSTSGRRFRKDEIVDLDESYRDWLENEVPVSCYEIVGEETEVRKRIIDPIPALQTLAEADQDRKALAKDKEALAAKTENPDLDPSEVSRDTKEEKEPARVRPGYGKSAKEKAKAKSNKIKAALKEGKKTRAELRAEVLGE